MSDDTSDNPNPWGTLVESGAKTIETRKWPVYKDLQLPFDLLICGTAASKTINAGKAICVVSVIGCEPMQKHHEPGAQIEVYDGAWAWQTTDLRWLSRKFDVRGAQKIFEVDVPEDVTLRTPTDRELKQLRYDLYKAGFLTYREVDKGLMASMEDAMTVKRDPL